jgi:glycosyltransferase involved in cell wall biosynthesis
VIHGKRIVVVMPAYNAEKTLQATYDEIPHDYVDDIVLVDDASSDHTQALSAKLDIRTVVHSENRGYGANQKTCYREALELGADVVVMLHPDYQYTPKLVLAMSSMVACGLYDVVLGSRILGRGALKGGMPPYKYAANRLLTLVQNILMNRKHSEYHTGYRAFSRQVLETLPLRENSDDFVFDNQMLAQACFFGFTIGEVSCPARYSADSSSIDFIRSLKYGLGVLATSLQYRLAKWNLCRIPIFSAYGSRIVMKSGGQGEPQGRR